MTRGRQLLGYLQHTPSSTNCKEAMASFHFQFSFLDTPWFPEVSVCSTAAPWALTSCDCLQALPWSLPTALGNSSPPEGSQSLSIFCLFEVDQAGLEPQILLPKPEPCTVTTMTSHSKCLSVYLFLLGWAFQLTSRLKGIIFVFYDYCLATKYC